MLVIRPSRSARPVEAATPAPDDPPRSDRSPRTISTIAPASLTAVKTSADVATTAASPAAARAPHASTPIEFPTVHTSARRGRGPPPRARRSSSQPCTRAPRAVRRARRCGRPSRSRGPARSLRAPRPGRRRRACALRAGRRDGADLGSADPARRVVELLEGRQLVRAGPGAVERLNPAPRDDGVAEALAVLVLAHLHVEAEQPLEQLEQRRAVLAAAIH